MCNMRTAQNIQMISQREKSNANSHINTFYIWSFEINELFVLEIFFLIFQSFWFFYAEEKRLKIKGFGSKIGWALNFFFVEQLFEVYYKSSSFYKQTRFLILILDIRYTVWGVPYKPFYAILKSFLRIFY